MFHATDVHSNLLALESIFKEASHKQHILKIAAAGSFGILFSLTHGKPVLAMHSIA
jgi:hypothetical protein